jgi:DNA-binding transcriptional LysR family regulator
MLDVTLLRTFLAIVDARSFTAAGQKLGLSQSTVSQHLRRLETVVGRQLLARDTHTVAVTADGNLMAGFARDILQANQRAADYFAETTPRDHVRFGVAEDLALTRLPEILQLFRQNHPSLGLELSVGLTRTLYQKLDAGRLDLVFAKRLQNDDRGEVVKREALCWMAAHDFHLPAAAAAPLVIYSTSSITSGVAIEALNRVNRRWFVACSSETLGGLRAAVLAGLGVTAQSPLLLDGELMRAPAEAQLPELDPVDYVVLGRSAKLQGTTAALAEIIKGSGNRIWRTDGGLASEGASTIDSI